MKIIGVKVEKRTGEESDFVIFSLDDVNYINVHRPRKSSDLIPVYHTSEGAYAPLLTLRDISFALKKYGFDYFDKSTIVNKKRVKHIKRSKGALIVEFVDNSEIEISGRSRYR